MANRRTCGTRRAGDSPVAVLVYAVTATRARRDGGPLSAILTTTDRHVYSLQASAGETVNLKLRWLNDDANLHMHLLAPDGMVVAHRTGYRHPKYLTTRPGRAAPTR